MKRKTRTRMLIAISAFSAGMGAFACAAGGPFAAAPYALITWLAYALIKSVK